MICNMLEGKSLPVYGKGENVRDWLFVDDHSSALWSILRSGRQGRTYNIGGETEMQNIDLVKTLADEMEEKTGASPGKFPGAYHLREGPARARQTLRHRLFPY